jgi:signal transduction histidine kinase
MNAQPARDSQPPAAADLTALVDRAAAEAGRRDGLRLLLLTGGLAAALAGVLCGVAWLGAGAGPGWPPIALLALAAAGLGFAALRTGQTALHSALTDLAHRQEAALRAKDDEMESLRGAKDALASMMVHDLRSPLGSVILFLDLIHGALEGAGLARDAESALLARGEAVRLNEMLGDLLLISRLEQLPTFAQAPTGLRALLEEVVDANTARTAAAGIKLELEVDPEARALIDQRLVRRALENLLANALRRMKSGDRVGLSAALDEREVIFTVSNTGAPVPEKLRATLVERASQRGERRAWRSGGFSLYLCKLVSQAHGGTFRLAERPGWSVTFELRLPAQPPAKA